MRHKLCRSKFGVWIGQDLSKAKDSDRFQKLRWAFTLRFDYATVEDSFYSAAMDYIFYVVSVSVFVAMLAQKWLEIKISKFLGSFLVSYRCVLELFE